MYYKILNLIYFVFIGLLLTAIPEWQNHFLMNPDSGLSGYIGALLFNAIILVLSFFTFYILNKKYSISKALLFQFSIWATVGLLIEWFLINHPPWSDSVQSIMFVYWGVFLTLPALFILEKIKPLLFKIKFYIAISITIMIFGSFISIAIDPSKNFLLFFIIFSWAIIFAGLLCFLLKAAGCYISKKLLYTLSILIPVIEILLSFPFDFIFFIFIIIILYWQIINTKKIISNKAYSKKFLQP